MLCYVMLCNVICQCQCQCPCQCQCQCERQRQRQRKLIDADADKCLSLSQINTVVMRCWDCKQMWHSKTCQEGTSSRARAQGYDGLKFRHLPQLLPFWVVAGLQTLGSLPESTVEDFTTGVDVSTCGNFLEHIVFDGSRHVDVCDDASTLGELTLSVIRVYVHCHNDVFDFHHQATFKSRHAFQVTRISTDTS